MDHLGILVSSMLFNKIRMNRKTYECIACYEKASERYGLKPCFFKIQDLTRDHRSCRALMRNNKGAYSVQTINTPRVIHNRKLNHDGKDQKAISALQKNGVIVFNDFTRYNKLHIYHLLNKSAHLTPHLPFTALATEKNVRLLSSMSNNLIIKPAIGSLGDGIMTLTRRNKRIWSYTTHDGKTATFSLGQKWPSDLATIFQQGSHIIQERISLATYEGRPYDIRVAVQKNRVGEWHITGLVAKAAKKGRWVTNVASGGTCYPLDVVFNQTLLNNKAKHLQDVKELALRVAAQLNTSYPNMADLGLDIGITEQGFPMFIECNGRDQRYSFLEAGLTEIWEATYSTVIEYADYQFKQLQKER
ncbi:YheC/YheD family protein [Thalassobacillus sp. CUG 92003]|uniref:YheC/YheD family protein n=1 Tax=Thalassobacillus sp. CUG 92003 TaxID=2736641 RepID=UPI0015E7AFBF|nr:YheC/YheD family protein [Thalassobacillus sp. CUG 92003]